MRLYESEIETEVLDEHLFLGECAGIALIPRGPLDNHIMFIILTEDDGNWFVSNDGFSSFWLDDLHIQLNRAKKWMEKNATKDGDFGYKFKDTI
uniref:Uncharacterized protein n=1 Tax=viral metagenome TaxID=1070528 RepID=A0A6M3LLD9_9ZZZZ